MKGKTVFITGGSRGIGKAIGLALAAEGANIVVAAKTTEPHPRLPGTIFTAAEEIEAAGGKALPIKVDIRSEEIVEERKGSIRADVESLLAGHNFPTELKQRSVESLVIEATQDAELLLFDLPGAARVD